MPRSSYRFARLAPLVAVATVMFAAGMIAGRTQSAAAAPAPMTPEIIHLGALAQADLPAAAPGSAMQTKVLAVADGATVQIQIGSVPKHTHTNSNEIQYVIQGQGKVWLGDSFKDVGPGDLIIIPKGTPHGATSTTFKALAIKTPPQAKDDIHFIP